jgi:hypothetical protein
VSIRRRTAGAAFALALAGSTASVIAAAVPASAQPEGNSAEQLCRSIADQVPQNPNIMGPCVSYLQSNPNASHGAVAEYLCKTQNLVPGTYPNVGQCVSTLNKQIPPPANTPGGGPGQ